MIEDIWHLRGSTEIPADISDAIIFDRLESYLAKQHISTKGAADTGIEFNSPLWEIWWTGSWATLVAYDRGTFWIESGLEGRSLRYDLRSLHCLVFCLAAALTVLTFASPLEDFKEAAKTALFAFAWLYGFNMVLAWARIPRAIRNAVNGD